MRIIYSSLRLRITGVTVLPLESLPPSRREWVIHQQIILTHSSTVPETMAWNTLRRYGAIRQPFFMIMGRCYFLDFFLPRWCVAVEIDGSSHDMRKAHDKQRDADFRSLGIKTIRVKNKDVMKGLLIDKINKRLAKIRIKS